MACMRGWSARYDWRAVRMGAPILATERRYAAADEATNSSTSGNEWVEDHKHGLDALGGRCVFLLPPREAGEQHDEQYQTWRWTPHVSMTGSESRDPAKRLWSVQSLPPL